MLQLDPATGTVSAPIWISATIAAVVVVLLVLALARSGALKTLAVLLAMAVVAYGGWAGFQITERSGVAERAIDRRAFERRTDELIGRAMLPGSPLGCIDGALNDKVITGCEQLLFGSADNVAAAVAYVSARLGLLIDGLDLASRSDADYEGVLSTLRRGLELDRFGVVAHVLARQPNCTPEQCELLSVLQDANRVRANLQEKPFDALVARYAATWNQGANIETSSANGARNPIGPGTAAPVSSRYDLPSAASIPPVSIMTSEPASATTTASTPPAPAPVPAARRPPGIRAPVARTAQPDAAPPVQLAPAAPATAPAAPTR
jgi:hypothetical protein